VPPLRTRVRSRDSVALDSPKPRQTVDKILVKGDAIHPYSTRKQFSTETR
jgi:hypothetical protein